MNRDKTRQFISTVEWILPRHLIILENGKYLNDHYSVYRKELIMMTRTKRVEPLKVIRGAVTAYCDPQSKKHRLAWIVDHDTKLRDFLARWFYLYGGMEKAGPAENHADFKLNDNLFVELDNGAMTKKQLKDKILKHYAGEGRLQVIFVMCSRYGSQNEFSRLKMLFEIVKEVIPDKPNRVLGVCYSDFFSGRKPQNYKGVEFGNF
jgi:hypothetical protein